MVDEVGALPLIVGTVQQIADHQGLVAGGRNFRHEDLVVSVHGILGAVGQIGVDGVAHLVGQSELAGEAVVVVQQNKGMDRRTGRVCAAPLAGGLMDIDPAVGKALPQDGLIFFAQRVQRIVNSLLSLSKGDLLVVIRQDRHIDVIEVQFIQTHQPFPHGHVTVEGGQILMDSLDEVVVDGSGHIGAVQSSIQGAGVLSGVSIELQLLALAIEHGGGSVAEAVDGGEHLLISILTQGPVGILQQIDQAALGQGVGLALAVHGIREGQVGVAECAESGLGRAGHLGGGGQQALLGSREGVLLHPAHIGQVTAVTLQAGALGVEFIQSLVGDGHDFRGLKAGGGTQRSQEGAETALHGAGGGITGVLVGFASTVGSQQLGLAIDRFHLLEIFQQSLGILTQSALVRCQLLGIAGQGVQLTAPGLIVGKQILNGPGLLNGDLGTGSVLFDFHFLPPFGFLLIISHRVKSVYVAFSSQM